jgi:RNA polymerase sigma factor (sigma-70 family)
LEQIRDLVIRAAGAADRDDRIAAYGRLVECFRDMACGYAYSLLGDFHLAEDAAQEAFVTAYRTLDQLRQPEAFPGWFRRIVWSACGRISRHKAVPVVGIDAAKDVPAAQDDPSALAEKAEMRDEVLRAISQLPDHQREVTTLFYINGYSQKDIADFLEVPVGTVKNRLTASRGRLKERMLNMVKDTLHQNAPGELFNKAVVDELLARPRPLEITGHPVREVALNIQKALPDFQNVSGEEIVEKSEFMKMAEHSASFDRAFQVDERRALRTETTITIMAAMAGRKPPVKLIVAGRVFRPDTEDGRHLKVFHQLDVLWIDRGLGVDDMKGSIHAAVEAVLKKTEMRWQERNSADYEPYLEFAAKWGDKWLNIGGCGMLKPRLLREAGYADELLRGLSYGLGLERLAAMKYGIDDIRKLWQPPYVPG